MHLVSGLEVACSANLGSRNASQTDASGNIRLGNIGEFLKDKITEFFKKRRIELNLKYIDPSYTIRSVPASPQDNAYCLRLAQNASPRKVRSTGTRLCPRES